MSHDGSTDAAATASAAKVTTLSINPAAFTEMLSADFSNSRAKTPTPRANGGATAPAALFEPTAAKTPRSAASGSAPASTRRAPQPNMLSLSLPSTELDMDRTSLYPVVRASIGTEEPQEEKATEATTATGEAAGTENAAAPPASVSPSSVAQTHKEVLPESPSLSNAPVQRAHRPSTPSQSKTPRATKPKRKATSIASHPADTASSPAPSVPMLQLPVTPVKDTVTSMQTLYTRLFHEAQQREQRQAQAQRKQRQAQKAEEVKKCTFQPRLARDFTAATDKASQLTAASPSAERPAPQQQGARSLSKNAAPSHKSPRASTAQIERLLLSTTPTRRLTTEEETAACVRLYLNTEQAERHQKRLEELRHQQEAEFRATCTFHPRTYSPSTRQRQEGSAARSSSHEGKNENGRSMSSLDEKASHASLSRLSATWDRFLADQEEYQLTRERKLTELKERAALQERPALYTGVPRSRVSQQLRGYLEKEKQYKGPVEGWEERFAQYMKTHSGEEAETSTQRSSRASPANKSSPKAHQNAEMTDAAKAEDTSPARTSSRSHSRSKTNKRGSSDGAEASASVFDRLFHDSDEREAMRKLIQMMREHREQTEFFHPNISSNGAAAPTAASNHPPTSQPRHSLNSAHEADTAATQAKASATAAAVAIATGGENGNNNNNSGNGEAKIADDGQEEQRRDGVEESRKVAPSIFDALFAEQEHLQRRRELRHIQAQSSVETYTFRPHVDTHSRALLTEIASQDAAGQHVETVRERRARLKAEAQAKEDARRAQIHFRYSEFAHRQAERNRKRDDALLHLYLQERDEDVEECRFRPTISEVTEEITHGGRTYTQLIDDPKVARRLSVKRSISAAASTYSSKTAAAQASHAAPDADVLPAALSSRQQSSVHHRTLSDSRMSHRSKHTAHSHRMSQMEALAAAAATDATDVSADALTSRHWYDCISAPVHTLSASRSPSFSSSNEDEFHRTAQSATAGAAAAGGAATHFYSPGPADISRISGAQDASRVSEKRHSEASSDRLDTVTVPGASSSAYLRQLESELQDALKGWSQCI